MAQRVRAFRKLKGLTQDELAQRVGMSIAVLGSIERGTRKADEKTLRKISEALDISLHDLLPDAAERKGSE